MPTPRPPGMVVRFLIPRASIARASSPRWWQAYQRDGLRGLRPTPTPGRPPRLSGGQLRRLERILARGPRRLADAAARLHELVLVVPAGPGRLGVAWPIGLRRANNPSIIYTVGCRSGRSSWRGLPRAHPETTREIGAGNLFHYF